MKRVLLGFVVFIVLSLVCGSAALAAPVGPAGEGFSIFAEYSEWYEDSFIVGVGYGFSEDLTVGGFYLPDWDYFGVYANLALGQFRVNGEVFFDPGCYDGMVSALYVFDLDPIGLGVGAGFDFCEFGNTDLFLEAAVELNLDSIKIYGAYDYYPDYSNGLFKVGASITF